MSRGDRGTLPRRLRITCAEEAHGLQRIVRLTKEWMEADGQPHVVCHNRWRNHSLSQAIFLLEDQVEEFWERDAGRWHRRHQR